MPDPYLGFNNFSITSKTNKDTDFLTRKLEINWKINFRGKVTKLVKYHSLKWEKERKTDKALCTETIIGC